MCVRALIRRRLTVWAVCRSRGLYGRTVTLKAKFSNFDYPGPEQAVRRFESPRHGSDGGRAVVGDVSAHAYRSGFWVSRFPSSTGNRKRVARRWLCQSSKRTQGPAEAVCAITWPRRHLQRVPNSRCPICSKHCHSIAKFVNFNRRHDLFGDVAEVAVVGVAAPAAPCRLGRRCRSAFRSIRAACPPAAPAESGSRAQCGRPVRDRRGWRQ
ncbi:hypothetical protein SAMN04488059_1262 [Devosia psychrophila]|uniref:Uncharacterized protein n=1 Tax=Devosia psychrophila TaxID=728005 RepID=A0A1I1Q6V9_9HYPH|nr:hypothetical protein SAMN04488059_1262 [Devosia psychrophila]